MSELDGLVRTTVHTGPENDPAKEVKAQVGFWTNEKLLQPFLTTAESFLGGYEDRVGKEIVEPALNKCLIDNTKGSIEFLNDHRADMFKNTESCLTQSVKDTLVAKHLDANAVGTKYLSFSDLKIDGK